MYNAQTVKNRIDVRRQEKGVKNVETMLKELGIGKSTVWAMTDNKGIGCFALAKIADYLDCSVDYLLGRTDTVDIPATTQFNGNNNGLQTTVNTGTVTIHSQSEHDDLTEMEQELLKIFRQLSFKEKIQLMDKLIIKNEV